MPGKTTFQSSWLELDDFKDWLSKDDRDKYRAYCKLCKKYFDVSGQGKSSLKQHSSGKTHQAYANPLKSGSQSTLQFSSTKNSTSTESQNPASDRNEDLPHAGNLNCNKNQTTVTVENISSNSGSINKFVTKVDVIKAEIIWAVSRIVCHVSTRSVDFEGRLFPLMFPDSNIAKQYSMKKDKAAYVVTYGLGEFFKHELLKKVSAASYFALSIDESLNKISKRAQMDMIIRFWCNVTNKLLTRYLGSIFLEKCDAETILSALTNALNELDLKLCNMIQLATDGPNVNLKLFRIFRDYLSNDDMPSQCVLLDVGTCPIHIVHNAYKTGHSKCGWSVNEFLMCCYNFLGMFPSRRADYVRLGGTEQFPLKFCTIRWLENISVLKRGLKILTPLKKYIKGVKSHPPDSKNYNLISKALKDKLLTAKMEFMITVTEDLYDFLLQFQTNNPAFPLLYDDLCTLIKRIGGRFLRKISFDSKIAGTDLIPIAKMDIGIGAKHEIRRLEMSDILTFRSECQSFLRHLFVKRITKSPIKNPVVRGAAAFDPKVMINEKKQKSSIEEVLLVFVENSILEGSQADAIKREYLDICTTQHEYLKNFQRHKFRLDDFLLGIKSFYPMSTEFQNFIKILFIIFPSNAAVERSFSINKECLIENLEEQSLVGQRIVYDSIKEECNFELDKLNITTSMIQYFKNSGTRRNENIKLKRQLKEEDENSKKNANQELLLLNVKKQKLQEAHDKELTNINDNIKYLERKLKN